MRITVVSEKNKKRSVGNLAREIPGKKKNSLQEETPVLSDSVAVEAEETSSSCEAEQDATVLMGDRSTVSDIAIAENPPTESDTVEPSDELSEVAEPSEVVEPEEVEAEIVEEDINFLPVTTDGITLSFVIIMLCSLTAMFTAGFAIGSTLLRFVGVIP